MIKEIWKVQKTTPQYGKDGKTTRIKHEVLKTGLTHVQAIELKEKTEKGSEDKILEGVFKLSILRDFQAEKLALSETTGEAKPKSAKPKSAEKIEQ